MPVYSDYSNFVKGDKGADAKDGSGESDGDTQVGVYRGGVVSVRWIYIGEV